MTPDGRKLDATNHKDSHETYKEHNRAEETEHVHGFQTKTVEEPKGEQIQIAIDKAIEATKLRLAEFACLVVNHLFAYPVETSVLCQIGNVAVHFAIDFYVLDNVHAVGFEAAIKVVEIGDAANLARRGVEEFRGDSLRQRVVALLLVS